jgi:hypothetical protein
LLVGFISADIGSVNPPFKTSNPSGEGLFALSISESAVGLRSGLSPRLEDLSF